jgi:DNA invertase Pin-like site-specific DNA recombinase
MAAGLRLVAYERVSTARQGASGLGLQAQRKVIEDFAASRGSEVLARFTEVESGRKADRPELSKALHLAKVTGATLVIAKLDRLSRNAAFLLALRDSGVRFVAVDMPEANDLTVGIMALVAQAEREAISRRTKEALAVAKARGVKLGNPNGAESLRRAGKGGVALRAAVSANAEAFAADLAPVLADIRAAGHTSLRAVAAELTARGLYYAVCLEQRVLARRQDSRQPNVAQNTSRFTGSLQPVVLPLIATSARLVLWRKIGNLKL